MFSQIIVVLACILPSMVFPAPVSSPQTTGFPPNSFQCIDDTQFKHFTDNNGNFVIGSCPPGKCVTRSPPIKNPCIGADRAAQIDGVTPPLPAADAAASTAGSSDAASPATTGFPPNSFQCIDDTQFKHFTDNSGNFVIGSCPPGKCVTRSPPIKNPCIGADRAAQIDGVTPPPLPAADAAASTAGSSDAASPATTGFPPNSFQCIDDTQFKHFTDNNGNFVIGSCPPGKCVTRSPPIKNPCIGADRAAEIDGNSNN